MALTYQTGLLQTIAYLMGERTVNATTSASRGDFLQKTLTEAYQAYPWKWNRATVPITLVSGIATLPTNYDVGHELRAYYTDGGGADHFYNEIDSGDRDKVMDGNQAFWLHANPDGTFLLKSKDTAQSVLNIQYQQTAPTLDSAGTIGTAYPNPMTLALGARRFVKLGQNPDADISQDQAIFKQYLNQDIAAEQIPHPRKRRNSRQTLSGRSTGDF